MASETAATLWSRRPELASLFHQTMRQAAHDLVKEAHDALESAAKAGQPPRVGKRAAGSSVQSTLPRLPEIVRDNSYVGSARRCGRAVPSDLTG